MLVIEATDLTKSFGGSGSPPVLDGITLNIEAGEVFGYLGPNGAGKTTTIRVLLGLLRPTRGTVRVLGETPAESDAIRSRIGVLMENSGLDERMTAYQNLEYHARLYGLRDPRAKIERLLGFVGLDSKRNEKVGTFSTGMRRKLGLARAIVHDPELLFLDEPSAGLDPEAQLMVRELLQELAEARKITVFINSHHLDEVQRLCSRIAVLHRGRIRANDTIAALRQGAAAPRLEVRLSDERDAARAADLLKADADAATVARTGATVTLSGNGFAAPEVIARLVHAGLRIEEVLRPAKSLEEAYFEIVRDEVVSG
jgi:ABC-2 type transport system ATP-binding protein